MTLILALPATDGVALVSDTRKWFRAGYYVDGHCKLVASRDGLITGTGSGQLLDYVAEHAPDREFAGIVALITRTAMCGVWDYEIADWTLTAENKTACQVQRDHGVGIAIFDGFSFKHTRWQAGSVPAGLPPEFLVQAHALVRPIFDGEVSLREIRTIAFDVYSGLYQSGLLSQDFDFGTHRPGNRIRIERLRVSSRATELHPTIEHADLPLPATAAV